MDESDYEYNVPVQSNFAPTKHRYIQAFLAIFIVGLVVFSAYEFIQAPNTNHTTQSNASGLNTVKNIELAILQNIQQNGYNSMTNGLWINWRYGTNPLIANGGDPAKQGQHDRLTDLRYLHNLLTYKSQNPQDTQFDSEISKYEPIVENEFHNGLDSRGFVLHDWLDMAALEKHPQAKAIFSQYAQDLAQSYYNTWYHPSTGGLYIKDATVDANGYYRSEDVFPMASGLIIAGKEFSNQAWYNAGISSLKFLMQYGYVPQIHAFLHVMGSVELANGAPNPDETILTVNVPDPNDPSGYTRNGGIVKANVVGVEIAAFLQAYQYTGDASFLTDAQDLIPIISPLQNTFGLWDGINGGYFFGYKFNGTSRDAIGTGTLDTTQGKEVGRQIQTLYAIHLADKVFNDKYADIENTLLNVYTNPAKGYYGPGHGYMYQAQLNWAPVKSNGTNEGFVTTEAMGIGLEALLSITADNPNQGISQTPTMSITPSVTTTPTISITMTTSPSQTPKPTITCMQLPPCYYTHPQCEIARSIHWCVPPTSTPTKINPSGFPTITDCPNNALCVPLPRQSTETGIQAFIDNIETFFRHLF